MSDECNILLFLYIHKRIDLNHPIQFKSNPINLKFFLSLRLSFKKGRQFCVCFFFGIKNSQIRIRFPFDLWFGSHISLFTYLLLLFPILSHFPLIVVAHYIHTICSNDMFNTRIYIYREGIYIDPEGHTKGIRKCFK